MGVDAAPTAWVGLCRPGPEPSGAGMERCLALLPAAMRPGVSRYRRPADQWLRLTARLLLARVLAEAGLGRLAGLGSWRRDRNGRPFLAGAGADVSISHTPGLTACAVGLGCRVGLDVEELKPLDPEELLPHLGPAERELLRGSPHPARTAVRLWSRHEAVLKADGRGLLAPEEVVRRAGGDQPVGGVRWRVVELNAGGRWTAHLALDRHDTEVRLLEVACDELVKAAA